MRQHGTCLLPFIPSFSAVYVQNCFPGSGTAEFGVQSTVLAGISDNYLFYRFTKVGIELISGSMFSTGAGTLGYYPETGLAANPSHAQNNEAPWTLAIPLSTAVSIMSPVNRVHWVPQQLLKPRLVPWLRTRAGGSDNNFEVQGVMVATWDAVQDGTMTVRLHYEIEYCNPAPPAVTLLRNVFPSDDEKKASDEPVMVMINDDTRSEASVHTDRSPHATVVVSEVAFRKRLAQAAKKV